MKKINLAVTGCLGRMGSQIIKSARADKRFKFCMERSRTRPGWKVCYLRYCQLAKADELLNYIFDYPLLKRS